MRKLEFIIPTVAFISSVAIRIGYFLFFVEFGNTSEGVSTWRVCRVEQFTKSDTRPVLH